MLFHSQVFILGFLPIVLMAYFAFAERPAARQWWLIAASLFFYAWWDVRFLPLIVAQGLLSWFFAELHFRLRSNWPLRLAIVANLLVLGLFKYVDFFVTVLEDASGLTFARSGLILPIGISFYTFQIVSYLIDALRGSAPRYDVRRFSLFVVFFPQLIAGPIVRHDEIIAQFDRSPLREGWAERLSRGLALFVLAAAVKVLIADRLAAEVDPLFAAAGTTVPDAATSLLAALGFALQIFFDFAAYSEMAIGLALAMGFHLPRNFAQPYRAASLQDFWRRWHMTLSRFLRDYLYIPLGGSRHGAARYVFAAMSTMALCGLWHGAGWNFIIWGVLHGAGLVVSRSWGALKMPVPVAAGWLLTFAFAVATFVVFRASDLATAGNIFSGLSGAAGYGKLWETGQIALVAAALALALQPVTLQDVAERWFVPDRRIAAVLAVLAIFIVLEVGAGQPQSFIYFQF